MFRSKRFGDLVRRQLDLFADDEGRLIQEAREADAAWTNASANEAEELYGDYQLLVDAIGDDLLGVREAYAASLPEDAADEYRDTFDRAARKRLGRLAAFLDDAW